MDRVVFVMASGAKQLMRAQSVSDAAMVATCVGDCDDNGAVTVDPNAIAWLLLEPASSLRPSPLATATRCSAASCSPSRKTSTSGRTEGWSSA